MNLRNSRNSLPEIGAQLKRARKQWPRKGISPYRNLFHQKLADKESTQWGWTWDSPSRLCAGKHRERQSWEGNRRRGTFNLAVESVATSSKADPPPYSFEDGGDETLDDRFLGCIQNAIHDEASFLSIQQLEDPSIIPILGVGSL